MVGVLQPDFRALLVQELLGVLTSLIGINRNLLLPKVGDQVWLRKHNLQMTLRAAGDGPNE